MKSLFAAVAALVAFGLADAAQAQVVTTFLPPAAIAPSPPVVVALPAPVVAYYSAPIYGPVIFPRRYVVPAPVIVRPRTYLVRPKVYVRGQPLRNTIRAVTP
ncbi:MAG TPA: hypothetical protein VMV10_29670 [Pirellulales bacterium]|nr:hypothetical protein [Pirellulales bacterium]